MFFFFFFPGSYSLMCGHCTEVSFIIDKTLHRIVIGSCLGAVARHSSRRLMRSLLLHFLSAHCILSLFFLFFFSLRPFIFVFSSYRFLTAVSFCRPGLVFIWLHDIYFLVYCCTSVWNLCATTAFSARANRHYQSLKNYKYIHIYMSRALNILIWAQIDMSNYFGTGALTDAVHTLLE